MECCRFVFSFAIFVMWISNLAESWKNNDDIFKDLGLDENTECNELNVSFSTSHKVLYGNSLKLGDVRVTPEIQLETFKDSKFHTLVMVDPDAPSRQNPVAAVRQMFNFMHQQVFKLLKFRIELHYKFVF